MTTILKTITAELHDIEEQNYIINIIHFRMIAKDTLEYAVNAYI